MPEFAKFGKIHNKIHQYSILLTRILRNSSKFGNIYKKTLTFVKKNSRICANIRQNSQVFPTFLEIRRNRFNKILCRFLKYGRILAKILQYLQNYDKFINIYNISNMLTEIHMDSQHKQKISKIQQS